MPRNELPKGSRRKKTVAAAVENLFFSRDESWMRFNQRVLEEAQDATNPLLERVKFLAITASNLDEFVEIRVASLLQRIEDGYNQAQPPDEGGPTPQQRLDRLSVMMHDFVEAQYRLLERTTAAGDAGGEYPHAAWRDLATRRGRMR